MKILSFFLILLFSFSSFAESELDAQLNAQRAYEKKLQDYFELKLKDAALSNLSAENQQVLISFTVDNKGFLLDSFFNKKSKQELINNKIDRLIVESSPYPTPPESLLKDGKLKIYLPIDFK